MKVLFVEEYSKRLRELISSTGISRTRLAEQAGLDYTHLWRIEKGEVRPGLDTLRKIARALGMSTGALLDYLEKGSQRAPSVLFEYVKPSCSHLEEQMVSYGAEARFPPGCTHACVIRTGRFKPVFSEGTIFYGHKEIFPRPGELAFSPLNNQEAAAGVYQQVGEQVILLPLNPVLPPEVLSRDAHLIRVMWVFCPEKRGRDK